MKLITKALVASAIVAIVTSWHTSIYATLAIAANHASANDCTQDTT